MSAHRPCRAFTIIELMVTIGVVALLMGILLPVLANVRVAAKRVQCLSNARQVATSINAFTASNRGRLPENRFLTGDNTYVTWRAHFAQEEYLPRGEGWACPSHPNRSPGSELGYVGGGGLRCKDDVPSSYALNGHILWRRAVDDDPSKRNETVIDRPAHTILVAETNRGFADLRASDPTIANYYGEQPGPYAYWHNGQATYSFQDGHAETISLLDTGNPDCRWHNGRDLTPDPFVPQRPGEFRPHDHPDWQYLVPEIYLNAGG